jgi:hypothetical protein
VAVVGFDIKPVETFRFCYFRADLMLAFCGNWRRNGNFNHARPDTVNVTDTVHASVVGEYIRIVFVPQHFARLFIVRIS